MCILAFISGYSDRFPFILIDNRDEVISRPTEPLAVQSDTNLLWAMDAVAGGSWLGMHTISGRFAVVTNCRRAPSAPLRSPEPCDVQTASSSHPPSREETSTVGHAHSALHTATTSTAAASAAATAKWEGAAPLSEILAHTSVVDPVSAGGDDDNRDGGEKRVTLRYTPPTSRGSILRGFLMHGVFPGETVSSTLKCSVEDKDTEKENDSNSDDGSTSHQLTTSLSNRVVTRSLSLSAPYYAGYNLLTVDSLFRSSDTTDTHDTTSSPHSAISVCYTSNRYDVPHAALVPSHAVHCLQNSYLDNWKEPKSVLLKALFSTALERFVHPLDTSSVSSSPSSSSSSKTNSPLSKSELHTLCSQLADHCLCATPQFPIKEMAKAERKAAADRASYAEVGVTSQPLNDLLHSTSPLLGFTAEELQTYFVIGAADELTDGGSFEKECELQTDIYSRPHNGYGTRMQSAVIVERVKEQNSGRERCIAHVAQRDVTACPEAPTTAPWISFSIEPPLSP